MHLVLNAKLDARGHRHQFFNLMYVRPFEYGTDLIVYN